MPEWLIERGIGETRAALVDNGHIIEARILRDEVIPAGSILTARLEALRVAVAGRNREIPEGITDLESLYLLWDLSLPPEDAPEKWTSIRVSPQQAIELEHKKMLEQARGEIARLVVKTTEQVLAKKLTDSDRASYNDAAAKELASL